MTTNGRAPAKDPDVAKSFSDLTHDVIELAELQTKLFMIDVKETTAKARTSLILAVIGVCVLLGTIPVILCSIAFLLIEQLNWSYAAGFGVATLVGLILSTGILAGAWMLFKNGAGSLERSNEELRRNINWIKSNLRSRSRPSAVDRF